MAQSTYYLDICPHIYPIWDARQTFFHIYPQSGILGGHSSIIATPLGRIRQIFCLPSKLATTRQSMQNVRVKLDLVYSKKPKGANTIQCLSLNLTLVLAGSVMLGPNAHHACRRARRISDADGRLPYMRSPVYETTLNMASASCSMKLMALSTKCSSIGQRLPGKDGSMSAS